MPTRAYPASHEARLALLTTALATATSDRAAGRLFLPQEWLDAVTAFLALYRPKVQAIRLKQGNRRDQIARRDAAVALLEKYVRHSWQMLKMRVDRTGEPMGVLDLYGVPAEVPTYLTAPEWVGKAETLLTGDAQAVAEGKPAICSPSAAEIQPILIAAQTEIAQVSGVVADLDEAQEAVQAEVPRADELINDLYAYLDFALRKETPASRRQDMRRYGVPYTTGNAPRPVVDPPEHANEDP